MLVPTQIISSVTRSPRSPRQVEAEFKKVLASGVSLVVSGKAKKNPQSLLQQGLRPKHKIELFGSTFFLTNVRQIPELRFFIAYILQEDKLYARALYKDLSLAWRSASHFSFVDGNIWVGKGDVRVDEEDGFESIESIEATTDLPLEMQTAVESLLQFTRKAKSGEGILELVLRKSPADRVEPYSDFTRPRQEAQANPDNLINNSETIAWFSDRRNPGSLEIIEGFQPDFRNGVLEKGQSYSKLYGGRLQRFRVLSENRLVQYYFIAGGKHVWVYPPQATTTQLSSYGVRTIDVIADDDLCIPGYEYHHLEETENGVEMYSQIPPGFAGKPCPVDDAKADASAWLDAIPMLKQFRKILL